MPNRSTSGRRMAWLPTTPTILPGSSPTASSRSSSPTQCGSRVTQTTIGRRSTAVTRTVAPAGSTRSRSARRAPAATSPSAGTTSARKKKCRAAVSTNSWFVSMLSRRSPSTPVIRWMSPTESGQSTSTIWRDMGNFLLIGFGEVQLNGAGVAGAISPDVHFGHPALRSLEGNLAPPSRLCSVSYAARLPPATPPVHSHSGRSA